MTEDCWIYCFVVLDACQSNPCQYEGKCTKAIGGPEYTCECVNGTSGLNCETSESDIPLLRQNRKIYSKGGSLF